MGKRQCAAGAYASLCLSQWAVLKMSLAKLGCTRLQQVFEPLNNCWIVAMETMTTDIKTKTIFIESAG